MREEQRRPQAGSATTNTDHLILKHPSDEEWVREERRAIVQARADKVALLEALNLRPREPITQSLWRTLCRIDRMPGRAA